MRNHKVIAIVAAMSLLLIAGCGTGQPASPSSQQEQVSVFESSQAEPEKAVDPEIEKAKQEQLAEEEPSKDGTEFIPEDTGIEFTTPYIALKYPEELQGKVTLDNSETEESYTVTFKTMQDGIELFSLVFTKANISGGFQIGTLNYSTVGAVKVFAVMNETTPSEWSEEQYNEFCSMQERVNDLIIQLYENDRFDAGR